MCWEPSGALVGTRVAGGRGLPVWLQLSCRARGELCPHARIQDDSFSQPPGLAPRLEAGTPRPG